MPQNPRGYELWKITILAVIASFGRYLRDTWEMHLSSSARLHFHSASPYIVDKSLIPMGVSRS